MEDFREIFKRELDRLTYLYVKADTISKKKRIAYDLIAFDNMYNCFMDKEVELPWGNDEFLIDFRLDVFYGLFEYVLYNKFFLLDVVENSFDIFIENNFSTYCDYGKKFHKLDEGRLQEYIINFYNSVGENLGNVFIDKLNNGEIFINNSLKYNIGVVFPIESLKRNFILFKAGENMCLEDARVLAHELGHDFEFNNSYTCGVSCIWDNMSKTFYGEVSACFFEYAFINYLIENKIYLEDAIKLKGRYLDDIFDNLKNILIIFSQSKISIDCELKVKLKNNEMVDFANGLLEEMNYDERYKLDDKIGFRKSIVYGIGRLMGIYIYEFYKNNSKEFLYNFRRALLEYKDKGIDAFRYVGVSSDDLIKGDGLRKTLEQFK